MTKRNQAVDKGQRIKIKVLAEEKLTCGECIGLTRERLITGDDTPCSKQGRFSYSDACEKFKPNSVALAESIEKNGSSLYELADILRGLSSEQLRVFAACMLNEHITRAQGYTFLQKIYVRFRGTLVSDYLSNFMTARILSADKDYVRVCSDDGKIVLTFENKGANKNVFTVQQFEVFKRQMEFKGRIVDPKLHNPTPKNVRPLEVPFELKLNTNGVMGFIDDIGSLAKRNKDKIRRDESTQVYSLVDIARDIDRGYAKSHKEDEDGHVELEDFDYSKETVSIEDLQDMGATALKRFANKNKIKIPKDLRDSEDLEDIRQHIATSYLERLEKELTEARASKKAKRASNKTRRVIELGDLED